ncbi:putative Histidine kinase [Desulfamplus magnetovallimortis]|uniref:histidine kinase n=1 Tax=Desulfamplus magnetovallimortis TaxID=1246637 RepID=A0A1W1HC70_9BACT|nr:PAS domain S-box protein [Desulfamplus magnetovallimortis]SLM30049.1 putative Histidine kinase [Desulfamplus magnetovallimortis]
MPSKPTYEDLEKRIKELEETIRNQVESIKLLCSKKDNTSESLFRGLFNNMTSGSAIYKVINDGSKGSDYIIIEFNRTSLKLEGKTIDQVIGKSLFDLRPNIDDYGLIPVMQQVWKTGIPAYHPVRIYQDDTFSNYYENYVFKIPSGEIVTIYNDVTIQKNNEIELKIGRERLELATRAADLGIWDWDIQKNELSWNDRMYELYGIPKSEFSNIYDAWLDCLHPDDRAESNKISEMSILGQKEYNTEFRVVQPDGTIRFIKALGQVMLDSDGTPIRMTGVNYDITELKEALDGLINERNFAENLIQTAQIMIMVLDSDRRIVKFNEYMEGLSGYKLEDVKGKDWFSTFVVPNNGNIIKSFFQKAIDDIQTCGNLNTIVAKDGREILIEWYDKPIKDKNGNMVGFIVIGQDITERYRYESERDITLLILQNLNSEGDLHSLIKGIVDLIQSWSGFEAVGIRLKDNEDYPYFETKGFPAAFIEAERRLCRKNLQGDIVRDGFGNPVLECMCGNIICGRFNPDQPFFTQNGSFWTNSTTQLLASTTDVERLTKTRNRCRGEGYESVALIPLKFGDQRLGLLQLNDPRPDQFDKRKIAMFERLASSLAVGLSQKITAIALKESEKKYRGLFETMAQGVFYQGADGVLIDSNPAFHEMFGLTRDQFLGKSSIDPKWKMIYEDGSLIPQAEFPSTVALRTGKPVKDVIAGVYNPLKEEYVWVTINAIPQFREGSAKPCQVFVTLHDITQRRNSEKELMESEEKFAKAFKTSPYAITITHFKDGKFIDVNDAFTAITGFSREEALSESSTGLNLWGNEEDRQKIVNDLNKGVTVNGRELPFRRKDGTIFTGLFSAQKIFLLQQGHSILSSINDISERKKIESALFASEQKYRSIMESMEDAVYLCSEDFHVEYMNAAMIKKVNRDAVGEICYNAIYGLNQPCPSCTHEKVMAGITIREEKVSDDNNKTYHLLHVPMKNEDGSISQLTMFRDISEIRSMEIKLQQAQKMEAIGTLAGGIAHDFNNILSPIIGYTELLLDDMTEESPFIDNLYEIKSASMRAKSLVSQILAFSRQQNSEFVLMKLQYIVKDVLKLLRATIPATIEIKNNIRKECGLIKADPTQMHQIIMNLATNAYHAMEESGGTMTISLKELKVDAQDAHTLDIKQGTYACLTLSDTGKGIPEHIKEKIFDPFFTTKEKGKGTGLGLSIVHGIVKSSGGAVCVDSQLGKGTEFKIYLPVVESYLKKDDAFHVKTVLRGGTERVLLVDDEQPLIALQESMLKRLGYQVTSRTSSIEALGAFRTNPDNFDLVITDMAMPNMSGDKLAVELIKIRPGIPILLCTGFSTIVSEEKALSMGIKGFLMKPITISDLDKKIRDVLDNGASLIV